MNINLQHFKKLSTTFAILTLFIFAFSFSFVSGEGGEDCDVNDPSLECNNQGPGSGVAYSQITISSSNTVSKNTPFDISWRAIWDTVGDKGIYFVGASYKVTLYEGNRVLKVWESSSPITSDSFRVGGISNNTRYRVVADATASSGYRVTSSEHSVTFSCSGCSGATTESAVNTTVGISSGGTQVSPGEAFDVTWSASWNTAEMESGRLIYTVILYSDGAELKRWDFDTENPGQAPTSGSYPVPAGIFSDKTYSVTAQVASYYAGMIGSDNSSVSITIDDVVPGCNINSFSRDNGNVTSGASTRLRFSLNGAHPWSIRALGSSSDLASGNSSGSPVAGIDTGPLTSSKTYRLTCGEKMRDVTVTVGTVTPPEGGGSGGWCGDEDSNPIGPRIEVPSSYVLLGVDRVGKYSNEAEHYEVQGATLNFSGVSTPPRGTNYIIATINMDDGGTVSINGTQVYSVSPTCSIKDNQIVVTNMLAEEQGTINVNAINSILGGVGAYVHLDYYKIPGDGEALVPVINAPRCSDTNYEVDISWTPVNSKTTIFINESNDLSGWGFRKVLSSGSEGSTPAPEGFFQAHPNGPQVLVFEPAKTYSSFILSDSTDKDGETVSWSVPRCVNSTTEGYLDTNQTGVQNCTFLSGWAWDSTFPNNATNVHIYRNGNMEEAVLANSPRAGLPGNTLHGFSFIIPDAWKTGTNQLINVYAISLSNYPAGNKELIYSPATINCAPPVSDLPDLTAGSVFPTSVSANNPEVISAPAINQGAGSTRSSFMSIFQVTPDPDNWGAIINLPAVSSPTIGAASSRNVSTTHTFNAGTHFARLCVDKAGVGETGSITESNEGNNCGEWTRITATNTGNCSDGIRNGDETGVDTGGRCTPGNGNCSDGIKNGDETGVDVGGRCLIGDPGSCVDGIKNGDETGIDTGGRCGPGVNGTCSDRIQNGDETGVDVGGRCGPGNGNCADGMRNGDETAVDYGGRCGTGRNLNVNRAAGGSVTSVDGRISCSRTLNSCSYSYNNGTNVVIDAKPASGYWKFTGWTTNPSGLCSGTSTRCSLNMTQSITVTPIFGPRIFDYREF